MILCETKFLCLLKSFEFLKPGIPFSSENVEINGAGATSLFPENPSVTQVPGLGCLRESSYLLIIVSMGKHILLVLSVVH